MPVPEFFGAFFDLWTQQDQYNHVRNGEQAQGNILNGPDNVYGGNRSDHAE